MPPKSKRKHAHAQIRIDVPQQDGIVTRLEVTRGVNQQILTKSTQVSVPVGEGVPTQHEPFQAPETLPPAPDDDPTPAAKKARKAPSRSVTVCLSFYFRP